jgi:ZIP family zinc transporter
MDTNTVLLAFGLTLIAGLSTGIGSFIAFFAKKTNTSFLTIALGFSAGVMLFVSFVDIFPNTINAFEKTFGDHAMLAATIAFFAGMGIIALIDFLIPEAENPHEAASVEDMDKRLPKNTNFKRLGIFVALSIAIHNFPEGLATFATSLQGIELALPIVVAIALHNIPEGIAVSVPIYQATGKKTKAFWFSLLSGLAEPIGALVGYFILMPFWNETIEGALMGITAGIMVYISLDELLPTSERYGKHHYSIAGLVCGMVFMAVSIIILQ